MVKKSHGKYIPLATYFACFVVVVIVVSLLWKGMVLWRASIFTHTSLILLAQTVGEYDYILLSPHAQRVVLLQVRGISDDGKSPLIPFDVLFPNQQVDKNHVGEFLQNIWHQTNSRLTLFDSLRIWWFAHSLTSSQITSRTYSLPLQDAYTKEITQLFTDTTTYQESQTIRIINASGVAGVGTRVAKMLTTIGMDVISITSSDRIQESTTIVAKGESYTKKRLEVLFGKKIQANGLEHSISDITIMIGKDNTQL